MKKIIEDTNPIIKIEVGQEVSGVYCGLGIGKYGHLVYLDKQTISANDVLANKIKRAGIKEGTFLYIKRLDDKKGSKALPYKDYELSIEE
jgi:hypothetical protein